MCTCISKYIFYLLSSRLFCVYSKYIPCISCVCPEFRTFEDDFDISSAIDLLSTLKEFCQTLSASDNAESTVEPESRSPSPKTPGKRGRKKGLRFSANQKERRKKNVINNPIFMHNLEVLSIVSLSIFDEYILCIFYVYPKSIFFMYLLRAFIVYVYNYP